MYAPLRTHLDLGKHPATRERPQTAVTPRHRTGKRPTAGPRQTGQTPARRPTGQGRTQNDQTRPKARISNNTKPEERTARHQPVSQPQQRTHQPQTSGKPGNRRSNQQTTINRQGSEETSRTRNRNADRPTGPSRPDHPRRTNSPHQRADPRTQAGGPNDRRHVCTKVLPKPSCLKISAPPARSFSDRGAKSR